MTAMGAQAGSPVAQVGENGSESGPRGAENHSQGAVCRTSSKLGIC